MRRRVAGDVDIVDRRHMNRGRGFSSGHLDFATFFVTERGGSNATVLSVRLKGSRDFRS